MKVSYTVSWINVPTYTDTDVLGFHIENAQIDKSNVKAEYTARKYSYGSDYISVFNGVVTKWLMSDCEYSGNAVATKFKMYYTQLKAEGSPYYTDNLIKLSGTAYIGNSYDYVTAYGEYYHQEAFLQGILL